MAIITLRQLLHRPAPGGPISANDPLPVRLYGPNGQLIGLQDDALKVALSGQTAPIVYDRRSETVTLIERQVRTQSVSAGRIPVPSWARAALVRLFVYGATGTFGSNEGARLIVRMTPDLSSSTIRAPGIDSHAIHQVASSIWANIGEIVSALPTEAGRGRDNSNIYVLQTILPSYLEVAISITGSFDPGQGIDCDLVIRWVN